MNPGLVVKLRPTGPWRIGSDSGARNRVDVIYHSDTLYSAITSAMVRLGVLDEWLDATARGAAPAVCFSSCYPFVDEIGLVVPPRSIWPPTSPALMSSRVRWKSARFVPLGVVQALISGRILEDHHWTLDGPSECLLPVGRSGPFRTSVRYNAAVDRLTGMSERHSTACLEFRPGAGLWAIVGFADDAARDRWSNPLKTAFRVLADSGFGGERSRGWGRSETPEFVEGTLPEMILGRVPAQPEKPVVEEPLAAEVRAPQSLAALEVESVSEPSPVPPIEPPVQEPSPVPAVEEPPLEQPPVEEPPARPPSPDPEPVLPVPEPQAPEPLIAAEGPLPQQTAEPAAKPEPPIATEPAPPEPEPVGEAPIESPRPEAAPESDAVSTEVRVEAAPLEAPLELEPAATLEAPIEAARADLAPEAEPSATADAAVETAPSEPVPTPESSAPAEVPVEAAPPEATPELEQLASPETQVEFAPPEASPEHEPLPVPAVPTSKAHPHWMLSLFTPAPADMVDWGRGNYSLLSRSGRVESPAGSGELKKQLQMIAEGSVIYAAAPPFGSAPDVAPDGFTHPVFRAGFALAIPLPEVS
jgi:CRISPR type III-A-associated RAMP protein Csm4